VTPVVVPVATIAPGGRGITLGPQQLFQQRILMLRHVRMGVAPVLRGQAV
jgi:hypothetical protein